MAVIGRIRKHSTILLVVIGLALFAFIMGDFVRSSGSVNNKVGTINGEDITYTDFFNRVSNQEDIYKRNTGKENLSFEETFQIREMVWEMLLQEQLLGVEYKRLGIAVTEEEMDDLIKGRNPHPIILQVFRDPETGAFNPAFVEQFVANINQARPEERQFFNQIVDEIQKERINSKYSALIAKSYYVPNAIAKMKFEESYSSKNIRVVQANYRMIEDSKITLTDDDYKKWYDEHKYFFEQDESVDIEYVIFDIKPTPEDLEEIHENVKTLYSEFLTAENPIGFINTLPDSRYDSAFFKKGMLPMGFDTLVFNMNEGSFVAPFVENNTHYFGKLLSVHARPDSIKASHLLVAHKEARNGENATRTKEEAKAFADSLLVSLKRSPAEFENAILAISEFQTAKRDTGNLNWMLDGDLNFQLFFDSLVTVSVNDFRIVESGLGYHILRVTDKTSPLRKVRIAIGKKEIEPSEMTIQNVYSLANQLSGENESIEDYNKAIVEKGYNKRLAESVGKMQYTIPGVQNGREIVRWCFAEKTKAGQVSQVYDIDGQYIVAAVKSYREEGYAELSEVKKLIEPMVIRDKKAEKLIDDINKIGVKDIDAIAQKLNANVDSLPNVVFASYNLGRFGPEPSVIGNISALKKGSLSKPIKGEQGVYVIVVDEVVSAPENMDFSFIKMQVSAMFNQRVQNALFEAIKDKAKIKDNRYHFY